MKNSTKSDDMPSKDISIIIPVYNEEENVIVLYKRIQQIMQNRAYSYEIIYVDDGSKDSTLLQLKRITVLDEHVQVVHFQRNFGQTAAIMAGVDTSCGAILVFMDGDLQNDPVDIPRLLAKLDEGYDVVSGWRRNRQDARFSRIIPSLLANKIISFLTGIHLHDYGCTLKAYRSEVFKQIRLYGEMHRFIPAYAALVGASIAEIEVEHHARRFGKSKYGLSRTGRVVLDLITLKFFARCGTRPLHAFGSFGLLALLLSAVLPGYQLICSVSSPHKRNQRLSVLLPTSLLLSNLGIISIMLGLLAEMLVRIYHEAQDKPTYVISEQFSQRKMAPIDEAVLGKLEVLAGKHRS